MLGPYTYHTMFLSSAELKRFWSRSPFLKKTSLATGHIKSFCIFLLSMLCLVRLLTTEFHAFISSINDPDLNNWIFSLIITRLVTLKLSRKIVPFPLTLALSLKTWGSVLGAMMNELSILTLSALQVYVLVYKAVELHILL